MCSCIKLQPLKHLNVFVTFFVLNNVEKIKENKKQKQKTHYEIKVHSQKLMQFVILLS